MNPDADAYHLLNTNLIFDFTKMRGIEKKADASLRIYATNLLDEDIYLPVAIDKLCNNKYKSAFVINPEI